MLKKLFNNIGLILFGAVIGTALIAGATTITDTASSDTLNTFRTNTNTNLHNLDGDKIETTSGFAIGRIPIFDSTASSVIAVSNLNYNTSTNVFEVRGSVSSTVSSTYIDATGYIKIGGVSIVTSTGADPSASIGLTAVNGTDNTFLRSDGAPALSQSIAPTWTGLHTFNTTTTLNATVNVASSTASRCARFDGNKNLVAATADCPDGDTTGAGGGGASSFSEVFYPREASFPTTNFPALNTFRGTNRDMEVLDFDPTTQETAYFEFALPSYVGSVATATLSTYWTVSSTNAVASTTQWAYGIACRANDAVWDAIDTIVASSTDTVIAAKDVHVTIASPLPTSTFEVNTLCGLRLYRDVAVDTLNLDSSWVRAILDIQW